jgi:hypothetical protein
MDGLKEEYACHPAQLLLFLLTKFAADWKRELVGFFLIGLGLLLQFLLPSPDLSFTASSFAGGGMSAFVTDLVFPDSSEVLNPRVLPL